MAMWAAPTVVFETEAVSGKSSDGIIWFVAFEAMYD